MRSLILPNASPWARSGGDGAWSSSPGSAPQRAPSTISKQSRLTTRQSKRRTRRSDYSMMICKVWDADYPWDVRVEKVARSLTDAGHEVHLVARNRGRLSRYEQLPEAHVHRLRPLPIGRRLDSATMFPAFFNPRWAAAIIGTARQTK